MKVRELIDVLRTMDPDGGVFVVLVNADSTSEIFDVQHIHDHQGNAQIEVHEQTQPRR